MACSILTTCRRIKLCEAGYGDQDLENQPYRFETESTPLAVVAIIMFFANHLLV